jgi:hypothetical protein
MPLALVAVLLAGCEPDGSVDNSALATGVRTSVPPASTGGCKQPGPQMRHWLPAFDRSRKHEATIVTRATNPCLPFADLLDTAGELTPDVEKEAKGVGAAFARDVKALAGHYVAVAGTAQCLYQADRLVIAIYQDRDHPASVGAVVAVGRDFATAVDVATCYLFGSSLEQYNPPADDELSYQPCASAVLPLDNKHPVVVMRFGTTNWMCDALARAVPRV